ncbi:MAG: hypothetical protein ACXWUD_00920 [Methylosarcina sp.]
MNAFNRKTGGAAPIINVEKLALFFGIFGKPVRCSDDVKAKLDRDQRPEGIDLWRF